MFIYESTNYNMKTNIYNLSENNMDEKILHPRIPDNFLVRGGYENGTTPRVCFSSTIDGCLRALSQNLKGKTLYVHVPVDIDKCNVCKPTIKQVPDCKITNEVWVTNNVRLKCIGKIYVKQATDKAGMVYTYGDNNKAELYDWDWRWVEKY